MVAAAWRRLSQAARWNGHAPQTTTGAASVSDSHCQASNCSAGIIASRTTGTVRAIEIDQPRAQRRGLVDLDVSRVAVGRRACSAAREAERCSRHLRPGR